MMAVYVLEKRHATGSHDISQMRFERARRVYFIDNFYNIQAGHTTFRLINKVVFGPMQIKLNCQTVLK